MIRCVVLICFLGWSSCTPVPEYDMILRGGIIYDGSGGVPYVGDVALRQDTIAALGDLSDATTREELDVTGLAIAPGFINVLSWAIQSLLIDGQSQSDIRQGVTLEIFGEGISMGPLTKSMQEEELALLIARLGSKERAAELLGVPYSETEPLELPWVSLRQYLDFLVSRGVAPNVASFVGATTIRMHELGYENRAPTPDELERMQQLVHQAMQEGALGLGSSLIYAPAFYAETDELVALASVAAEYNGLYISHLRSEGNRLLESIDELIHIAEETGIAAEIYHLKAAGRENWDKLDAAIQRIENARAQGLDITANMYTYTAGATGLDAAMPPWVQEGGFAAWHTRLQDPAIQERLEKVMMTPTDEWENLMLAAGPENVMLVGFNNPELRSYVGTRLDAVAAEWEISPAMAAIRLVVQDSSRVETVYHLMTEDNVRRQIALPWISFGSDAESLSPRGVFAESHPHPRAYGTFARLLGKYVREERVITLEEAIRRITSLPATNLHIPDRGRLEVGYFADLAVFDPAQIADHATFEKPHQFATGMVHVFVNGEPVFLDREHTAARPGRVVTPE